MGRGRARAIMVSIVIAVTGDAEVSIVIVVTGDVETTIAAVTIEVSAQTTMGTVMADIAAIHTDVEVTAIITLHTTTITTVDLCLEYRGRTELLLFIRISEAYPQTRIRKRPFICTVDQLRPCNGSPSDSIRSISTMV